MLNPHDREYLALCDRVLSFGESKDDRTGVGTLSLFRQNLEFDLEKGFPLLTTKKVFFKGVVNELLWFLSGSTNVNELDKSIQHWWSPWAKEDGSLGPIYGENLRRWKCPVLKQVSEDLGYAPSNMTFEEIDQIKNLVENIKKDPNSRRLMVSTLNVAALSEMALPPCHGVFVQFNVDNQDRLSCFMVQRSADLFLGFPCNIASYALLTHMLAQVTNTKVGSLYITIGNAHLYKNHLLQIKQQLKRSHYEAPNLFLNPSIKDLDMFKLNDIMIQDYIHHGPIKGEVAI